MGSYAVDAAELQGVDAAVQRSEAQARAALGALTAAADDVLGQGWSSPAALVFRTGWADWLAAAHGALDALSGLGRAVGAAGYGYSATDGDVRVAVAGTPA